MAPSKEPCTLGGAIINTFFLCITFFMDHPCRKVLTLRILDVLCAQHVSPPFASLLFVPHPTLPLKAALSSFLELVPAVELRVSVASGSAGGFIASASSFCSSCTGSFSTRHLAFCTFRPLHIICAFMSIAFKVETLTLDADSSTII